MSMSSLPGMVFSARNLSVSSAVIPKACSSACELACLSKIGEELPEVVDAISSARLEAIPQVHTSHMVQPQLRSPAAPGGHFCHRARWEYGLQPSSNIPQSKRGSVHVPWIIMMGTELITGINGSRDDIVG
ncbi:hypothetical protein B0H14DRAFT_2623322 [Mycena olivaceomarginata]|nr:hypothetical protein B0H14DRAFT_2623322 [Mycena olivaceomarginata]